MLHGRLTELPNTAETRVSPRGGSEKNGEQAKKYENGSQAETGMSVSQLSLTAGFYGGESQRVNELK